MIKYIIIVSVVLASVSSYCQDTIRWKGLYDSNPKRNILQPIYVYDGIPYGIIGIHNNVLIDQSSSLIDSVSVRKETVFNDRGEAKYYGIIEIFTKDSINTGLKYILQKTNYWIYRNPLASLEINGNAENWDSKTTELLLGLKPDDVIEANVIDSSRINHQPNGLLRLKIKR